MKLFKTVIQIGIFALFLFTAFLLVTSKTNKLAGLQSFVVLTGSMQPTIPQGSIILTKNQARYNKGDIISFRHGDITVTHRIAQIKDTNSFVTKGDANKAVDTNPLLHKNILGKQIFFIPLLGNFLLFLKTVPGFIAFVITPAIIFIVAELYTIKKEFEKEVEKKFISRITIS